MGRARERAHWPFRPIALSCQPMSVPLSIEKCRSVAVVLTMVATACVGGTSRGTPLYAPRGQVLPVTEVAQLVGEVATVDGKSVHGRTFELLPGCHVVTTPTSWGVRDQSGSASGNMAKLTFVITMHANKSYVMDYELSSRTGNGGTMVVHALERDAAGNTTATLLPVMSQSDIEKCQSVNAGRGRG